jgi:hypothetical protein
MVLLLIWPIAGAVFVLWRWMSLGRERSSVAAYEAGLRELATVARKGATGKRRPPPNPMPGGHVRVLPTETAVLRPARRARKQSGPKRRRLGISA